MKTDARELARFGESLDTTSLRAKFPTLYQEQAHESRSDRYSFIHTGAILEALQVEGFFYY
jgi:hypothetical protein